MGWGRLWLVPHPVDAGARVWSTFGPHAIGAERFCESLGAVLGIAVRLRRRHPGMTQNGSGALGCLGYELSVVDVGVDLTHRFAGLMSSLSNPLGL
jgi:hypothetical protein